MITKDNRVKTLYVSDLDGTLLDDNSQLSERTVATLNRIIGELGGMFTIATARTPATVVPLMQEVRARLPWHCHWVRDSAGSGCGVCPHFLVLPLFRAACLEAAVRTSCQGHEPSPGRLGENPATKGIHRQMELTPIVNDAISQVGLKDAISHIDLRSVLKWSLAKPSISVLRGIPVVIGVVSGWAMVPVYLAVFLAARPFAGNDVSKILLGLSERTRRNIAFLIDEFIRIVVLFFRG